MSTPREPNEPPRFLSGGARLVAVVLVLGALALAADLAWMTPHPAAASAPAGQPAAQDQASPTAYFPSQFTLNAKDDPAPAAPTF